MPNKEMQLIRRLASQGGRKKIQDAKTFTRKLPKPIFSRPSGANIKQRDIPSPPKNIVVPEKRPRTMKGTKLKTGRIESFRKKPKKKMSFR